MTWLALEEWANGLTAGTFLGEALSLRKVSFDASLKAMWPGTAGRPLAYELILRGNGFEARSGRSRGQEHLEYYPKP